MFGVFSTATFFSMTVPLTGEQMSAMVVTDSMDPHSWPLMTLGCRKSCDLFNNGKANLGFTFWLTSGRWTNMISPSFA
jgi:hypothetical protein